MSNQALRSGTGFASLVVRLAWICLLAAQVATARAADRPSTLLEDANLEQASRFAVNAAQDRGWSIQGSSNRSAVFEQILEAIPGETEYDGEPATVLRIMAEFVPNAGGTIVHLEAEEIRNPGAQDQTIADVTQLYRDNLMNALWSLRMKWETRNYVPPPNPGPLPPPSTYDGQNGQIPTVGVWAYYAEQFAQDSGCKLTERGAVLESAGTDTEQHKVHCEGGPSVSVTCNRTSCWSGR